MSKEDKELLLKDLCARLPYWVKVTDDMGRICTLTLGNVDLCSMFYGEDFDQENAPSICKPYLRPMSSMTEEERQELLKFGAVNRLSTGEVVDVSCIGFDRHCDVQDWLNKHHFDYRGLIEKDLALEAPEGMYKIKD